MDAISLLKDDHKKVEELFKKFESTGERAYKTKRQLVDRMIEELSRHADIEEEVFYPRARQLMGDQEEVVLEALEEHHIVEWTLSELQRMDPKHERFDAKVSVLIENVRHHVKEEEKEMLPKVRKAMKPADLRSLGEEMQQAKGTAPAQPKPRPGSASPDAVMSGEAPQIAPGGSKQAEGSGSK